MVAGGKRPWVIGHRPWVIGHRPWVMGHGPCKNDATIWAM